MTVLINVLIALSIVGIVLAIAGMIVWERTYYTSRTTWEAIRGRFSKEIKPITVDGKIDGIPVKLTNLGAQLIKAIMTDTELGTVVHLTRISDTETQVVAFHTDEQGIRCEGCNRDKPLDTELDSDMVAEFVSTMHQVRAERQVVRRMIDIFGG